MDLSSLSSDPNFFGKDSATLFIGQVEDVNDPKRSGRVKVRCLGWHPPDKKGDKGLSTDDLPWTRTCLPVTGAQQMRSGAKHGLLPGSWVVGMFVDGSEANDGFAFATFNFTAKASDKNNREDVDITDGKIPDDIRGFTKINPIIEGIYPNTGLNTEEEMTSGEDDPGDIAHDSSNLDDSTNGPCHIKRDSFSTTVEKDKTGDNQHSQKYPTEIADALCGTLMSARDVISSRIKEKMPSGLSRFVDGDDVFDINGNAINLNGIMRVLSGEISSMLKDTIQTQKAFLQKTVNKQAHSLGIFAGASRSPLTGILADMTFSTQFDILNSIIDRSLDQLEDQVMQSLQNLNNQQKSSKGSSNNTGELGTSRGSTVVDLNPIYIADSIINDTEVNYRKKEKESQEECEELVRPIKEKMSDYEKKMSDMLLEDYECQEDMEEDIQVGYDDIVKDIGNAGSGGGSGSGGGGFDLGQASQFLQIALNMDFTLAPQVFNKAGLAVLDSFTGAGCNPYTMYETVSGKIANSAGSSGGGEGGGSESGKSSKRDKDMYKSTGFGGRPGEVKEDETTSNIYPDDVKTVKFKQTERKKILATLPRWEPVDYYEVNRTYELQGEVEFDGTPTRQSRVLVNNQDDPTDNGIYVTNVGPWVRSQDANFPTDFKKRKLVEAKNQPDDENLYYYSNKSSPKLRYDDVDFKKVVSSPEFTREEKRALDRKVENEPDGTNASVFVTSRPSGEEEAAKNYVAGRPNTPIVANSGKGYFFDSKVPGRNFPSIVIEGYLGTPVPVVDRDSGEMVTVLINQRSFSNKANPSVSIIPDDSSIGIVSDSKNYDIFLSHFYVQNTGIGYDETTEIEVIDKDRNMPGAVVKPRIVDGRIVSIEVINNGSGFKRLPKIKIKGKGRRAKLYPIMGLKVKESNPSVKKLEQNVVLSLTPTTANLYTTLDL